MARWEFAPGSPWNTMRMDLLEALLMRLCSCILLSKSCGSGSRTRLAKSTWPAFRLCSCKKRACPLEVRRRVDPERNPLHDAHVDAHSGFERPQLLELLAQLERRGGQRNKAGERGAAISVDADVMIERPLAMRCFGTGEVERPEAAGRDG